MRSRRTAFLLIAVLLGAPLAILLLRALLASNSKIDVGGSSFEVEVIWKRADRDGALERGSRARPYVPLLICEARPRYQHFSPKGVMRRLDAVFLDATWRVVDVGLLAPGNDEGVTSTKEAAAALFLDAGDWAKSGAKIGDAVTVPDAVKKILPEERAVVAFEGLDCTAYVEVASTEDKRRRGLMWRERMSVDDGMLFKYTADNYAKMMAAGQTPGHWMRNTRVPLTIAYIKENGTIDTIHAHMKPLEEKSYPAKGEWMYALEMNRDWFEKHGIREGDKVVISKEVRDAPADE